MKTLQEAWHELRGTQASRMEEAAARIGWELYAKALDDDTARHAQTRDAIGQAVSDVLAAHGTLFDICDSRNIDELADAALGVLIRRKSRALEQVALLRLFQNQLGSSRDMCDDNGRRIWDAIDKSLLPR